MKQPFPKYPRILAIAPICRGFGFAVIEGANTLADWGVKSATGEKNQECVKKVREMIAHYKPDVIALEDTSHKSGRKRGRICRLTIQLVRLVEELDLSVMCFSREEVVKMFFPEGKAAKYLVAQKVAEKFPDELAIHLPNPNLRLESEHTEWSIFDAAALGLMVRYCQKRDVASSWPNTIQEISSN